MDVTKSKEEASLLHVKETKRSLRTHTIKKDTQVESPTQAAYRVNSKANRIRRKKDQHKRNSRDTKRMKQNSPNPETSPLTPQLNTSPGLIQSTVSGMTTRSPTSRKRPYWRRQDDTVAPVPPNKKQKKNNKAYPDSDDTDDSGQDSGIDENDPPPVAEIHESEALTEGQYYIERIEAYEHQVKEDSRLYQCPCCGEEKPKKHFKVKPCFDLDETIGTLLDNVRVATNSTECYGVSHVTVAEKYRKKLEIYRRKDIVDGIESYAVCNYWFVAHMPITQTSIRLCNTCNSSFNKTRIPTWSWKEFPIQRTPEVLAKLSSLESSLLCKVLPVVKVIKCINHPTNTRQGVITKHACNVKVNNAEVIRTIPRSIKDTMLELHIEKKPEESPTSGDATTVPKQHIAEPYVKYNSTYYARRKELLEAIDYMYATNRWYTNKEEEVDMDKLNNLEENLEDDSAFIIDERIIVDEDGEVDSKEADKSIAETIKGHIQVPDVEKESSKSNSIFIPRTNQFANWKDTPNLVELTFPPMFPDGNGGLYEYNMQRKRNMEEGNDSNKPETEISKGVTYSGFFEHCLLFYTRQFQYNKNFIAWFRSELVKKSILGICTSVESLHRPLPSDLSTESFVNVLPEQNVHVRNDIPVVESDIPQSTSPGSTTTPAPFRSKNRITVQNLQNIVHANDVLLKVLRPYYNTYALKGTKVNMEEHRRDLFTILSSGNMPIDVTTFFVTLSSGDLNWPSLYHMIDPSLVDINGVWSRDVSFKERLILLAANPVLACVHFLCRFESFIDNIVTVKSKFNNFGDVVDHWFRIEFQTRGSIHAHGFYWSKKFKEAVEWLKNHKAKLEENLKDITFAQVDYPRKQGNSDLVNKDDTSAIFSAHEFYEHAAQKAVSTTTTDCSCDICIEKPYCIHYDENDLRWESVFIHPNSRFAQKVSLDHPYMLYDLLELIKANQWHIHKPTCYKYLVGKKLLPGTEQQCRMRFDKAIHEGDFELTVEMKPDELGRPSYSFEIYHKRDIPEDTKINAYHVLTSLTWRANHDMKFVGNPYGLAVYTTKYSTKAENQDFLIIDEKTRILLEDIFMDDKENKVMRVLHKYLYTALGRREMGMQEACWLGLGYPLVLKTRKIVKVNTLPPELKQRTLKPPRLLKQLDKNSTDIYNEPNNALITAYMNRPSNTEVIHNTNIAAADNNDLITTDTIIINNVNSSSDNTMDDTASCVAIATGSVMIDDISDISLVDVATDVNMETASFAAIDFDLEDYESCSNYSDDDNIIGNDRLPVSLDGYDTDTIKSEEFLQKIQESGIDWDTMTFDTFITWFTIQAKPTGIKARYACHDNNTGECTYVTLNNKRSIIRKWPYISIDYNDKVSLYSIMLLYMPFRSISEIDVLESSRITFDKLRASGSISETVIQKLQHQALLEHVDRKTKEPSTNNADDYHDSEADDRDLEHSENNGYNDGLFNADEFFMHADEVIDSAMNPVTQQDIYSGGINTGSNCDKFLSKCIISARKVLKSKIGIETKSPADNEPPGRVFNNYKSFQLLKKKLQMLNLKQLMQMEAMLTDIENGKQIFSFISGGAGVGKSFLIEAIELLAACISTRCQGLYSPAAKMSPSANAATLIGGGTIHSMIGMTRFSNTKISNEQMLQSDWTDVSFLIIDEISMCDKGLLSQIDKRLRRILKCDNKFGGLHVIFSGDFYQLPPVDKNSALYMNFVKEDLKKASHKYNATALMKSITRYNGLDEIERTGNYYYASALKILRLGPPSNLTQEECDRVAKYFINPNIVPTTFAEALALMNTRYDPTKTKTTHLKNMIAARWKVVDKYNEEGSYENKLKYGTITIYGSHVLKSSSEKVLRRMDEVTPNMILETSIRLLKYTKTGSGSEYVPGMLVLAINDRVLITAKISQELGLVNGAKGTVYGFLYDRNYPAEEINLTIRQAAINPPPMPILLVKMDKFDVFETDGKTKVRMNINDIVLPENVVPIRAVEYTLSRFPIDQSTQATYVRTMLPVILARCTTIHKCQGQTYGEEYGFHTKGMFEFGMGYTGCSRSKDLSLIHLLERNLLLSDFNLGRNVLRHIRTEYARLEAIGLGETNVDISDKAMELNHEGKYRCTNNYVDNYISRIRACVKCTDEPTK